MESTVPRTPPAANQPANAQPTASPQPTSADIDRLLAVPARFHAGTAYRDRALLEVLCDTGLQASELAELNVADVDSDQNTILCGKGSHRQRTLKLSQRTADALVDYLAHGRAFPDDGTEFAAQSEQPLFLNHRGRRLTRQGVWMIVRTHAAAIGLDDGRITPRTLRHSVATRLLQSGVEPRETRQRLGINRLAPATQNDEQKMPRLLLDGKVAVQ